MCGDWGMPQLHVDFIGGHGTFLGYTNSIVHAVMYAYYFVTSTWPEYKGNIWWKKYITQLQMVSKHKLPIVQNIPSNVEHY
jgi:hypothetical protein